MDEVILTTCPRDCYDACGVAVVKRDGHVRVRGDRSHPVSRGRLCVKCSTAYNGVLLDPRARLLHPLRRTGPKGAGEFERVSWDDALAEVAERFGAVPGETILNAHYTGTFALLGFFFPQRLFNRLGATEVDPDTICNKAGHVALDYLYGTSLDGFDPRTARDSAAILVWGANPSASAPHQHDHWLPEAPGEVIVVDPFRTPTAAAADLHLAPFPGSDAALAFALLHVIVRDGLSDPRLLEDHAVGFEQLEPVVADCTPEWGERVTGVPAGLIERAARLYGEGPSLLWIGQGFQRQPRGGNAVRAVGLLPVVSGNLGKPGTGLLYLNGTESRRIDEGYLAGTKLASAGGVPDPVSHMDLAERLEDPARARALCCWNINIAASNPDQARLRRALARDDLFTVVVDLFGTDTTDYADIVLPATSFLECDDLVASYFHISLSAQVKATDPLGESLPNTEIFRRLARAMGLDEPALHESDAEMITRVLEPTGIGFSELAERGTVWLEPEPVVQFSELRFPTPTGRVEIASEQAEADGHSRLPEPHADPRPDSQRLRLLSPASSWLMNDSFANDPKLTRRLGAATVKMHPLDASDRGLTAGDTALLESSTGQLALTVELSDAVPRGVIYSPKGRWPKREPGAANINVLNPGVESDMGHSTTVHGLEVSVTPA